MITAQDVVDMTDLSAEEVEAIAEHEGLPEVNAACLGEYMLHCHKGGQAVQEMICDDIRAALHRDDVRHARDLYVVLKHFVTEHPEAARGAS